jgi:hypothetical protein
VAVVALPIATEFETMYALARDNPYVTVNIYGRTSPTQTKIISKYWTIQICLSLASESSFTAWIHPGRKTHDQSMLLKQTGQNSLMSSPTYAHLRFILPLIDISESVVRIPRRDYRRQGIRTSRRFRRWFRACRSSDRP